MFAESGFVGRNKVLTFNKIKGRDSKWSIIFTEEWIHILAGFDVAAKEHNGCNYGKDYFFHVWGFMWKYRIQIYINEMYNKEGLLCRVAALRQKPKDFDNGKIAYSRSGMN
jgi:hypothetical protein